MVENTESDVRPKCLSITAKNQIFFLCFRELDIPRTVEQMRKAFENIKSRGNLHFSFFSLMTLWSHLHLHIPDVNVLSIFLELVSKPSVQINRSLKNILCIVIQYSG